MTDTAPGTASAKADANNGFFINAGTHSGWFTTTQGDIYDIRKLEPREVSDPRSGEVATIWGGYATARDREIAAKDSILQAEFKRTGERPAELFTAEAKDIPLYITLRHRPGKGYSDIGSFWNARGRHTVLARDLEGKRGLRFAGNVLEWKSAEAIEAERAARAVSETPPGQDGRPGTALRVVDGDTPDGAAARVRAEGRSKTARAPKAPAADKA